MRILLLFMVGALAWAAAGCASSTGGTTGSGGAGPGGFGGRGGAGGVEAPDYTTRGPAAVGVTSASLDDESRQRTLPVEIWYPIAESGEPSPVLDFEQEPRRSVLEPLLLGSPEECVARTTTATRDAPALAGSYSVVLYTHCYNCTRWSAHAVAEHLVSHGFVVVSADHEGDTLFDRLNEANEPLSNELVDSREADVRVLLDRVLSGDLLPDGVAANASQVGLLGHSVGSVTAGRVAENDARFAAIMGMAAPMENILLGQVSMARITVPVALLEATEDNSVGVPGNVFIGENFADANLPAYKLSIVDAGHWSPTNIAGLTEEYEPGCGDDTRQTNGEPFSYVEVETANDLTAAFATAFFSGHLREEATALDFLRSNPWPEAAPLEVRE